ncbi:MAG: recombination-associated protein RdgC [Thermodesulfobacteriota bacterium]|nr:recombination-associated protein RdgC [Thermodesulfobacteriota bacterium]
MRLLSSSVSITRYKVKGEIQGSLIKTVMEGLNKNSIMEIDNEPMEKTAGWTSFDNSYLPDFETSSCFIGAHFVFSLRIDKKNIPSKIIRKYYTLEVAKKLAESGREHLSRNEKKDIKEHVTNVLILRIPATPNIYDIIWNYEESSLWFFSNQKAANEDLETLFSKSFRLSLIRLFPYTMADLAAGLTDRERDLLSTISRTKFMD